jgi:hypothetical protein
MPELDGSGDEQEIRRPFVACSFRQSSRLLLPIDNHWIVDLGPLKAPSHPLVIPCTDASIVFRTAWICADLTEFAFSHMMCLAPLEEQARKLTSGEESYGYSSDIAAASHSYEGSSSLVVFKGTFYPILGHAIGISGDTERYVSIGGPVLVLDRRPESLNGCRDRGENPRSPNRDLGHRLLRMTTSVC